MHFLDIFNGTSELLLSVAFAVIFDGLLLLMDRRKVAAERVGSGNSVSSVASRTAFMIDDRTRCDQSAAYSEEVM